MIEIFRIHTAHVTWDMMVCGGRIIDCPEHLERFYWNADIYTVLASLERTRGLTWEHILLDEVSEEELL